MTVTSEEYWQVDGTILNTLAYNIATQSGRHNLPDLRGENHVVPHRPGELWRPKTPGARSIELSMWVIGADEDGLVPTAHSQRAEFNANLRTLQRLFFRPQEQLTVVRRTLLPTGTEIATATAAFMGGLTPEMTGNTRAELMVELALADPWFYGAQTSFNVSGTVAFTNLGDVTTPRVVLTMPAGSRLTDDAHGYWVQNDGAGVATVDVAAWTATIGGAPAWSTISHNGEKLWFPLREGATTLTAAGGTVGVAYSPAYI